MSFFIWLVCPPLCKFLLKRIIDRERQTKFQKVAKKLQKRDFATKHARAFVLNEEKRLGKFNWLPLLEVGRTV